MPALKISICRKTGEVLSKEYIDDKCTPDIDGLARVIAQRIVEDCEKERRLVGETGKETNHEAEASA